jgi:hypothetical protein
VAGGRRKLHIEELHNVYSTPNVITTIRSRRMKYVGHVALMGNMINTRKILVEKPERRLLGRLYALGGIILK